MICEQVADRQSPFSLGIETHAVFGHFEPVHIHMKSIPCRLFCLDISANSTKKRGSQRHEFLVSKGAQVHLIGTLGRGVTSRRNKFCEASKTARIVWREERAGKERRRKSQRHRTTWVFSSANALAIGGNRLLKSL